MTIDKQELRRLAEKATPGPWVRAGDYKNELGNHIYSHIGVPDNGIVADAYVNCMVSSKKCRANADLIAAANPATVLALLDELHSAESRLHEVATACATAEQERDELREVLMRLVDLQNSGRGPMRTFKAWNEIVDQARRLLGLEVRP